MGSSSTKTLNEINDENNLSITYRVKLPKTPILSPELDEKYLFIQTIEDIEKGKVFFSLGSNNLFNFLNVYNSNVNFLSFTPVVFMFLYRRFRNVKLNSKAKSFVKAFPVSLMYYYLVFSTAGQFQYEFYLNFFKQDLNLSENEVNEYFAFKTGYMNLLN